MIRDSLVSASKALKNRPIRFKSWKISYKSIVASIWASQSIKVVRYSHGAWTRIIVFSSMILKEAYVKPLWKNLFRWTCHHTSSEVNLQPTSSRTRAKDSMSTRLKGQLSLRAPLWKENLKKLEKNAASSGKKSKITRRNSTKWTPEPCKLSMKVEKRMQTKQINNLKSCARTTKSSAASKS